MSKTKSITCKTKLSELGQNDSIFVLAFFACEPQIDNRLNRNSSLMISRSYLAPIISFLINILHKDRLFRNNNCSRTTIPMELRKIANSLVTSLFLINFAIFHANIYFREENRKKVWHAGFESSLPALICHDSLLGQNLFATNFYFLVNGMGMETLYRTNWLG